MILSKKYLKKLIKEGKSIENGTCIAMAIKFVIVYRLDLRRTDHYKL